MKTKLSFIAILLLMAMLLGSCTNTPDLPENTEPPTSDNSTDTSTETPEDPFELLRSSGEEWITYGIAAYEKGKRVENLKEFFSDRANLTYLTLYDHFFTYDKAKSVPVAEALFAFIYDKYGAEAILNLEKRCEYKDEYLRSLGLDVKYANAPEVEVFLASMDFSSNTQHKYIFSFGNVTYYFKDFDAGSPTQYHGFIYYNTTGLLKMIDHLKNNGLSEGLNTERKFNYYMIFDGSGYNKTLYSNGDMYINDSYYMLHEAVHAMGITKNDNIWLSEGLCNYFGKSLGFNAQVTASYVQLLTMAKQGYFDEQANVGNTKYVFYKRVYEEYIARGGKIESVNTFDLRLYTDVNAKIELDTNTYETLGYAYKLVNNTDCNAVGSELSYEQATSLVLYLVDTYGIEKVLDAYHSQDIASTFGKGYEELKSDWLVHLYN